MRGPVALLLCLWGVIAHAETPESSTVAPTIPNNTPAPSPAPDGTALRPGRAFPMVEVRQRRELAASARAGERYQREGKISGCPNRFSGRGSLREMGGQTFADRSGV